MAYVLMTTDRDSYLNAIAASNAPGGHLRNISLKKCRVLLFEDNPLDALYFCETLLESEHTKFEVEVVPTLKQGVELLDSGSIFHLLVVDLSLPDCDGMETFEKVTFAAPKLPVVILSGLDDREVAMGAVQFGAQDYLVKGDFQPYNLEKSLSFAIERRRLQEDVNLTARELQRRLDASLLAQHIQENLFPERTPEVPGFDLAARSFQADETGGDFFDYLTSRFTPGQPQNPGTLGLLIADVGGHGIGPALIMSAVRSYMRGLQRYLPSLSKLLFEVNNFITQDTRHERLISLFLAELNVLQRTITFCGAGHESHLLRGSGDMETLRRVTFPLGIEYDVEFTASEPVQLYTGDILVMHTDGIAEATDQHDQPYGIERLLEVVAKNRKWPAMDIIEAVYADVQRHTGQQQQNDDITLMVLKAE